LRESKPHISVVVPAFNEEGRIGGSIRAIEVYLARNGFSFEIIVSDDGSADKTVAVVNGFAQSDERIKVVRGDHGGKGGAVKNGVLRSRGELVLFSDVDLSTPIEELSNLKKALDEGADIAIASRDLPESKITKHQSWYRELLGKLLNKIIQVLYVPGIHDTQCGFKLFKGDVARKLFSEQKLEGFLFDVEILHMARKKGYRIAEIPVTWRHNALSKVRVLSDLPRVVFDLLRIRFIH
jgi:dolichyl-phosphate beta-glucosyltransferase